MTDILNFDWASLAAMLGSIIAAITLVGILGVRFKAFRIWIGQTLQDITGVLELNRKLATYVEVHEHAADGRDRAIESLVRGQTTMHTAIEALAKSQQRVEEILVQILEKE